MKNPLHAVLIMAHKNKEQLIRLIKSLSVEEMDVYVHLDKNWKLSKEEIAEIKNVANNVYLVDKRVHGELDKWSLVQITLNLIESALENEKQNGIEYKYFMLLSGQDYPIKKKEYILNFLEKQYPKPLIDICEICKIDSWCGKKFLHVSTLNKIDAVYKKHPKGLLRKIKVEVTQQILKY